MFSIYAIRFDIQKFYVLVKQDIYVIKHKQSIVKHKYINDFINMYSYFWSCILLYILILKGKVIPLQARCGPEDG